MLSRRRFDSASLAFQGNSSMIRKLALLAVALAALGCAVFWILTAPQAVSAGALGPHRADPANGRTLFLIGGCSSCHATPGQKDPNKLGGGLALKSPFGTFYPPNISSDPKDGIGAWTEAAFVTAMTKGTSPGGEHLFPAFPYTSYQRITFNDLRDLLAFLKTLPAVQGRAREHELSFPFDIRRLVGGWKLLFLDGLPFQPDPSKPDDWNRGAYLVNGPGHCAECHSPRNFLGAIVYDRRFTGGPSPDGEDWVPNITQARLKTWSEADIAEMLASGMTPNDRVSGPMREVVRNTAQLTPDDRAAMAVYIKSLAPVEGLKPPGRK
jgi:mono/diheme cytochrome c family protein